MLQDLKFLLVIKKQQKAFVNLKVLAMSQFQPFAQIKFDETISSGTKVSTPNNADTGYALEVDSKNSSFAQNVHFIFQFYPEKKDTKL